MQTGIPSDVAKTVALLRDQGREKLRLADELERHYTGTDPRQPEIQGIAHSVFYGGGEAVMDATLENLTNYLREKSGRPADLAKIFRVNESRIRELIASSGGKLTIPDWRGWVKIVKHK
jgi:hypothetical protein